MISLDEGIVRQCLRGVFRPIARLCLRHHLPFREASNLFKEVLVEEAREALARTEAKESASRISVMTGVNRKEVTALTKSKRKKRGAPSVIAKVIGAWSNSKRYLKRSGEPKTLGCHGDDSEFNTLVRSVSSDVNPYTVLAEMERLGLVKREDDKLQLVQKLYVPKGDFYEGFRILSDDASDLVDAVEENILSENALPNLHIRSTYDNIDASKIPAIRRWLLREGSQFQQKVREYLSQYDLDINPGDESTKGGARVTATAFSFTELPEDKDETTDE